MARVPIPPDQVFWKTAGYCVYCGVGLTLARHTWDGAAPAGPGAWVIDCWVPEGAMGPVACAPTNLWPACSGCHAAKRGRNGSAYILYRRSKGRPTNPLADAYIVEMVDWFTRKVMGIDAEGSSQ